MCSLRRTGVAVLAFAAASTPGWAAPPVHHAMRVELDPASHRIAVVDTIRDAAGGRLDRAALAASLSVAGATFEDGGAPGEVVVRYEGTIRHPISREGGDYARGFAETEGTIGPEGVFLGGSARWYATPPGDPLATFELDVRLPAGWDALSQGRRTVHERSDAGTRVVFVCEAPQESIWLVAGKWHETARAQGRIEARAFLRERDDALAATYLDATGPYVEMYEKLVGPYPYDAFSLVENFWETGYGMPGFTLLGPKVIRLPFILTTSYPHEILHNWWGNGVYVARGEGNWCEGLTAYLADHLFQEQRGTGASYRQESLQKYGDYASRSKDIALAEFTERHSPATEAIGYGKALLVFHMIRGEIGDAAFVAALRALYSGKKFDWASWDDLLGAFAGASGRSDLSEAYRPWIDRAGAPRFAVRGLALERAGSGYKLSGVLAQTQEAPPFRARVPVAVTLEGQPSAWVAAVLSDSRETRFAFDLAARPLRVDLDPEYDVFRALAAEETPPALSSAYGADEAIAIVPADAPADLQAAYRAMIAEWSQGRPHAIATTTDRETAALPATGAVFVLGWENRHVPAVSAALAPYGAALDASGLTLRDGALARADHAAVSVVRDRDRAIAFVAADRAAQVPGLTTKLPHYHKYSFLGFEGDAPTNTLKGRWPAVGSPTSVRVPDDAGRESDAAMGSLPKRAPLAELPAAFSKERLLGAVRTLADPALKGRGIGTPEIDRAADWIAAAMKEIGLEPAGDEPGSYFSTWTERVDALGAEVRLRNVVGRIRGTKPEWARESVVVGAHYDHLGEGAFGARAGQQGSVHPGADDNASGVAVLLELARRLRASGPPQRGVVFAAFTGEEAGLLGSRRFLSRRPAGETAFAMVNFDTVGRLGSGKVLVLGASTADEWIHIAQGAGFVTGAPVQAVMNDPGGSDQKAFHAEGIPAVQFFTGAHEDYHSPGDTTEKVDADGLVKVAAVAWEFVSYLAGRDRPLTVRLAGAEAIAPAPAARRAALGGIPDYAFEGPGVKITGTMPGSAAEKAGLLAGDVIVAIGEKRLGGMKDYAAVLAALAPGDVVRVTVVRDGSERTVEVTLGAR